MIGRQSTCRHDAVYVRMKEQFLIPTVKHTEETNFCSEQTRIAGDLEQSFGTGAEQQIVDCGFVA